MDRVVGSVVQTEFVRNCGVEDYVWVELRIELYIIKHIGYHIEVRLAALIPVGRHIRLGELQGAVEGMEPVDAIYLAFGHEGFHRVERSLLELLHGELGCGGVEMHNEFFWRTSI